VEVECLSCIIHRGYLEITEATKNPSLQFKASKTLLEYLAREFAPRSVAAVLGTTRDRIIKRITGNSDIYSQRKRASNQAALKLLPALERTIEQEIRPEKRFRTACLAAIVGNTIEFDIPEHEVDLEQLEQLISKAEEELAIDEISKIHKQAKEANEILYLADNAGEIALDKLLINELKQSNTRVIVVVKGGPILNDATLDDAKEVTIFETADNVITTGADAVGLPQPEERSQEFNKAYQEADFIIAKGMGYAETLTEDRLEKPHAFLLRTKCNPVARYFGVERNRNVAKLIGVED